MKFVHSGKIIKLKGDTTKDLEAISPPQLRRLIQTNAASAFFHIHASPSLTISTTPSTLHPDISALIMTFAPLFQQPTYLPPPRPTNHSKKLLANPHSSPCPESHHGRWRSTWGSTPREAPPWCTPWRRRRRWRFRFSTPERKKWSITESGSLGWYLSLWLPTLLCLWSLCMSITARVTLSPALPPSWVASPSSPSKKTPSWALLRWREFLYCCYCCCEFV